MSGRDTGNVIDSATQKAIGICRKLRVDRGAKITLGANDSVVLNDRDMTIMIAAIEREMEGKFCIVRVNRRYWVLRYA